MMTFSGKDRLAFNHVKPFTYNSRTWSDVSSWNYKRYCAQHNNSPHIGKRRYPAEFL